MATKLILDKETLDELSLVRDLDESTLLKIKNDVLAIKPHPAQIEKLYNVIENININREDGELILNHVLSLCDFQERNNMTVESLLEFLNNGIISHQEKDGWTDAEMERWNKKLPLFKDLIGAPQVLTVVKSSKLSYDYDKIYKNGKIITDIRPIFNKDCSEIVSSLISFTLNIIYFSDECNSEECTKKITLTLDSEDVKNLLSSCDKALKKARVASAFMGGKDNVSSIICGE